VVKAWPNYINVHEYIALTYWLLYLHLKLSSGKLSYFSESVGLLVNSCISWSQMDERGSSRGLFYSFITL
jgi:hypothetical protein